MTDAERELRDALAAGLNLPGPWAVSMDLVRAVLPLLLEREARAEERMAGEVDSPDRRREAEFCAAEMEAWLSQMNARYDAGEEAGR